MSEATCRREIDLEIPAENVQKATEKVARDIARIARIPGFRPGKAPVTLVRRRFAGDIQGEVVQSLVPEYLEKALDEKKLVPITRPEVDKIDFKDGEPLRVHAVFEVLPEFELGDYNHLEVRIDDIAIGDAQVDQTLEEMRERAATFVPVEGRPAQDGDSVLLKLSGMPKEGGDAVHAESVLVPLGAEQTLGAFTENLRGASPGETKRFEVAYPADYPDAKLAGKSFDYSVEVQAVKAKQLPELNDEFAKDMAGSASAQEGSPSGVATLDELRKKIRESLEAAKEERQKAQARDRILETLVKQHDFPVPEALVESQMDTRLERTVRSLAVQGVDPRAVNVDWAALRRQQRDRAIADVKAELILDHIATAQKIDVTDEDVDKEVAALAQGGGESAQALRARLTKQGALDRIKSKLRSDRTIEWLYRTARIEKTAKGEK